MKETSSLQNSENSYFGDEVEKTEIIRNLGKTLYLYNQATVAKFEE